MESHMHNGNESEVRIRVSISLRNPVHHPNVVEVIGLKNSKHKAPQKNDHDI